MENKISYLKKKFCNQTDSVPIQFHCFFFADKKKKKKKTPMELKGNQKCLLTSILQNNLYDPLKKAMHAGLEQHKVFSRTNLFFLNQLSTNPAHPISLVISITHSPVKNGWILFIRMCYKCYIDVKGIVHPKIKIPSLLTHLHVIPNP